MQYDLIKDKLNNYIKCFGFLRILTYYMLDIMLLRQRYVKYYMKLNFKSDTQLNYYDAGAGFCQYSWFSIQHWPNSIVHASDLKTEYLSSFNEFAQSKYPGRFSYCIADLQCYKPIQSFNLITAIDILEHIPDDISTLKHLYDSLQMGGKLIISTPSDMDEAAKFTEEHCRPGYNKSELENKICNIGFKIDKSIYTYGFWGKLSWKLMMKYPLKILSWNKWSFPFIIIYYLFVYPICEVLMRLDMISNNKHGTGLLIIAHK